MFPTTDCTRCHQVFSVPSRTYAEEPDRLCGPCITAWAEERPCPDCGGGPIKTSKIEYWFRYGSGHGATQLKSIDSLRTCQACKFQFLDYETERIHLMAVNQYHVSIGEPPREK